MGSTYYQRELTATSASLFPNKSGGSEDLSSVMATLSSVNAEARAWRILLASFVTFLSICALAVYGLQWFLFQSVVPLKATLSVARGTARIVVPTSQGELAVTDIRTDLGAGTIIQTDASSQAVVTFQDPSSSIPIAALVVFRDSQILVKEMSAPQFGLNRSPYRIAIVGMAGRGQVRIFGGLKNEIALTVSTSQAEGAFSEPGLYWFDANEQWSRFAVTEGGASVKSVTADRPVTLVTGNWVSIDSGSSTVSSLPDQVSIVNNPDFSRPYSVGWRSYDASEPAGSVYNSRIDGRDVVVIDRSQEKYPALTLNHGETGLSQVIDANVEDLTNVEVRITLFIDEQNLSACGIAGSECPLMFRLEYTDAEGVDRVYIHGFYANHDPGLGYPLLCDTCRAEHDRISLQSWYTYSENLFSLIPPDQRPSIIRNISLYSSGHAYKVYVAEADLVRVRPLSSSQ